MDNSKKSASDASVGPVELIFASVVVAIWLAAFAFGYWEGRDIGSMLFSQNVGTDQPCETSYADRAGKYMGQRGVTLPKL